MTSDVNGRDPSYLTDLVVAPSCLLMYVVYHLLLARRVYRKPETTVIGITRRARRDWVYGIASDQNYAIIAVQTLRNWLMAASMLGSVAISLSVGIMALVATLSRTREDGEIAFLSGWGWLFRMKIACLITCFIGAFISFLEVMRYLKHLTFFITTIAPRDCNRKVKERIASNVHIAASMINRAALCHTIGLRVLLFSFPVLVWLFTVWLMPVFTLLLLLVFQCRDDESEEYGGMTASAFARDVEQQSQDEEVEPLLLAHEP
ncbi:hypothetical protein SmJEL517_g02209 [Synchytrium microbalum]|uniref:DUF599 domain-containing protein n=1 Tax=Synchytrium microbalum TaxID=1806994 RepID=A0A507C769_9FUNG|nr:uncharacterized protein SmJEL517_g02209 [Synchytrium microbalum]TPX35351.1 hypothetical protein SmJEL517_g02209 [Synchytrium microbalum]